ncbi:hypothetical protein [Georgenia sp. AZ-5]|uniref:hypothetical protein n=1 Tax=Georgenia sp. AZ-5 TaxID=3367526 RepID=UPI0037551776
MAAPRPEDELERTLDALNEAGRHLAATSTDHDHAIPSTDRIISLHAETTPAGRVYSVALTDPVGDQPTANATTGDLDEAVTLARDYATDPMD